MRILRTPTLVRVGQAKRLTKAVEPVGLTEIGSPFKRAPA
jgi:hypothetical protein